MMMSQHDPMMDMKSTKAKTDAMPKMPTTGEKTCCDMAEAHDGSENVGTTTMSKDAPPAPASPGENGNKCFGAPDYFDGGSV